MRSALDLAHGQPWLEGDEVLAVLEAEKEARAAKLIDVSNMFAELRTKPKSAWAPYLETIKDALPKQGVDVSIKVIGTIVAELLKKFATGGV